MNHPYRREETQLRFMLLSAVALFLVAAAGDAASAEARESDVQSSIAVASPTLLDPVFGDHAVLQRGRPIPIWGRA